MVLGNCRAYGFGVHKKVCVHFIDSGEISHVCQENVDFDGVMKTRPSGLKDGIKVA